MAFFVIRESDALSRALDISIVIDGVEVLNELPSVACACAMMFGLIYALNLKYPEGLKYTFEAFQKRIMDIESKQMSRRVQNLSSKLQDKICFLWPSYNVLLMVNFLVVQLTLYKRLYTVQHLQFTKPDLFYLG